MSPRFRPVIRVFVSSSFRDLKEERNALQREAFPRLEHYCLVRGFQFQAIDLRWGVPGEAKRDHRAMEMCFEELRRAQEVSPRPNFLVLLGDRYGWQSLAETITEAEFREIERAANEVDGRAARRAEARGSAVEALRTWYRRDDNAVPVEYQLRSRNDWPGLPEWTEEAEEQAWKKVEEALWAAIDHAYPTEGLVGRFGQRIPGPDEPLPSIVKFKASATEQEIWRGALAVPDAAEHVVAWYRTIRNRDKYRHDTRADDFLDPADALQVAATELKDELRRRLHRDGKKEIQPAEVDLQPSADGEKLEVTRHHLLPMCEEIEAQLREIVDEEIGTYWSPPGTSGAAASPDQNGPSEARKLELEAQAHQLFAESRAPKDGFVGRDLELTAIDRYLSDENDCNPLVIHGPSGTGKTALLARAAKRAAERSKCSVLIRFLGTTPQSSNLRSLLQNLCRALRPADEIESQIPMELRELQDRFNRLLALATAEQPILLFLDALDQLDEADGARQGEWLRTPLPPHVKVVVSCIRDEDGPAELNEAYRSFERRKLLRRAIAVESLSAPDAMIAIDLWLRHDHRRPGRMRQLTTQQREAIAACTTQHAAAARRRPLYLRILFEECRLWPSWKTIAPAELGEDTPALLEKLFDRLAQPAAHGALLVESALSYIASARRGLSESELLEALWADPDYKLHLEAASAKTRHELPPGATRIPIAIWSRLRHDLDPYIAEHSAPGGVVLNFYHRVVGRVVAERYLNDPVRRCLRHNRLAKYFQSQLQPWWRQPDAARQTAEATATLGLPNARRATELPWQLLTVAKLSAQWDAVEHLLTELSFLESKALAGMVFELADDFRQAIQVMPVSCKSRHAIEVFGDIVGLEAQFLHDALREHPQLLFQSLWNKGHAAAEIAQAQGDPIALNILEQWRCQFEAQPFGHGWMKLLNSLTETGGQYRLLGVLLGHQSFIPALCVDQGGNICVTAASHERHLLVWDLRQSRQIDKLTGHQAEMAGVAMTPDGRTAVSIAKDLSLIFWNVASGRSICAKEIQGCTPDDVAVTPDGITAITISLREHVIRVWQVDGGRDGTYAMPGARQTDEAGRRSREPDSFLGHHFTSSVVVDRDGQRAAIAIHGVVVLFDISKRVITPLLPDPCGAIAFSLDGKELFCARGKELLRCDCSTLKAELALNGLSGDVYFLKVLPGGRLFSADRNGTATVWNLSAPAASHTFPIEGRVAAAWMEQDNLNLAVKTSDGGVFIHSVPPVQKSPAPEPEADRPNGLEVKLHSVCISGDGALGVAGSEKRTMVWDARNVKLLCESKADGTITSVALSGNGSVICAATKSGSILVLDPASGSCLASYQIKKERPWTGDISAPFMLGKEDLSVVGLTENGAVAVIGAEDRSVIVWSLADGAKVTELTGHQYPVNALAVNGSGEWCITGSGNTLRIYRLPNPSPLHKMMERTHIASVSISQKGDVGASAAGKAVNIWSTADGKLIGTLRGHSGRVSCVFLDPAGRFVISCSEDRTLRLWSLSGMSCVGLFNAIVGLECCASNLSQRRILAGDSNGQIYFLQHVSADKP